MPVRDPTRRADSRLVLAEPCGSTYRTAAVLLDPVLVHLSDGAMVFRGVELVATTVEPGHLEVREHVQVWHCVPMASGVSHPPG